MGNSTYSFRMIQYLFLLLPVMLSAQTVYLSATHPVYRYLDKMEAKQIIVGYRDAVKPMSREVIAHFIVQIDTTTATLTEIEQEEQFFYKEEFFQELGNIGYENIIEERWHLYQYLGDPGRFNINLIGGFSYHKRADGLYTQIISNGVQAYGYIGTSVGVAFTYRDNAESGSSLNPVKPLTSDQAQVPISLQPPSIYYDPNEAQLNVDFGFVSLSAEKMHNVWGAGSRGNVILSDKSPSYPQIKLRAKLSESIDFTYLHGWLFSDILDSSRIYQTMGTPGGLGERLVYRSKYIAAHILEFTPWDGVDLAIGESQIYASRSPEPMYLIPVMFFKAGEHWMKDTDNSQMFLTADLNIFRDQNYYLSLFIDEISTTDFAKPDKQHNQLGFTVGASWYDLAMPDTRLWVEYTRTNPWVYNHRFSDATFQSHSVNLGHWIGQNADLFSIGLSYRPIRTFEAGVIFESLRKGGKDSTVMQYRLPTPSFLYGPLTKRQIYGIVGNWEPSRDMMFDFRILRSRFSTDVSTTSYSYINNPNEYIVTSNFSSQWDLFLGIRYNFD
jgi:hypothetical protein